MDGWSVALLAGAAYVAIVALVRLMIRRRDQRLGELRRGIPSQKRPKGAGGKSAEQDRIKAA